MPAWNLIYRVGVNCTLEDFHREQQVFRSDPMCSSYQYSESPEHQGVFAAQIEFNEPMNLASEEILHRRMAEAVPSVPVIPILMTGVDLQVDLSSAQESNPLQIGARVCVDAMGRIGSNGTPIGILLSIDRDHNQARIRIEPGSQISNALSHNQMREYYDPPSFSREEFELARIRLERRPMELPDQRVLRARQEIMAAEDARIFEALDAFADYGGVPKEPEAPPEPRPVFKSRYQRILDSFK